MIEIAQALGEARLPKGSRVPVDGQVYCLEHTTVHDDTTDPYRYGEPDCKVSDHRKLFWYSKRGDML